MPPPSIDSVAGMLILVGSLFIGLFVWYSARERTKKMLHELYAKKEAARIWAKSPLKDIVFSPLQHSEFIEVNCPLNYAWELLTDQS